MPQTIAQDNKTKVTKSKRSDKLTPTEVKSIKKYAEKFDTKEEAALDLGIDRGTLNDVIAKGSCATATKDKLLTKINAA